MPAIFLGVYSKYSVATGSIICRWQKGCFAFVPVSVSETCWLCVRVSRWSCNFLRNGMFPAASTPSCSSADRAADLTPQRHARSHVWLRWAALRLLSLWYLATAALHSHLYSPEKWLHMYTVLKFAAPLSIIAFYSFQALRHWKHFKLHDQYLVIDSCRES